MTRRLPVDPSPAPLETYAAAFDDLFTLRNQRHSFRRYLEGLLLPAERNKTLTGLANTEPGVGSTHPRVQGLQWFLSESTWDPQEVNSRRLELLRADPATAPDGRGVLVIDEHGDRKWGDKTAHVGRQYLANIGKIDSGVVSVTTLWADEHVYYPLHVEPYTPAHHFEGGKADPAFRTKLGIAVELVGKAVGAGWRNWERATCWRSSRRTRGGTPQGRSARCGRRPWARAGRARGPRASGRRWCGRSAADTPRTGGRWRWRQGRTDRISRGARWWRRPTPGSSRRRRRGT